MRAFVACLVGLVGACSSPAPVPDRPAPPPEPAPVAVVDAAVPDAGIPQEVLDAPAWVFRYNATGRLETWTLRHARAQALVEVVTGAGARTRYTGTATEGETLALAISSGPTKMTLDCKRSKQEIGKNCGERNAKKTDVLECFHPDFKAPMTFAATPGIEYVATDRCRGYQLLE